jgi:hypothetical protein
MLVLIFIIINFVVSSISDVILNLLSRNSFIKNHNFKIILSLKPYFTNKTILQSAIYAGLTIMVALLINMIISKNITGIIVPKNNSELFKFILIAFPLGYIVDIIINECHIFGNELDLYYKVAGAGLWGAIAFVFSIIFSYLITNMFL